MFEEISILGRIAYGICCLENYISALDYLKNEWKEVFNGLWSTTEFVDDWIDTLIEYKPDCILEFADYDSPGEWEYVDEDTYKYLYRLYSQCPSKEEINSILTELVHVGNTELYTGMF